MIESKKRMTAFISIDNKLDLHLKNMDQIMENPIETDLDDKYMQNEGKDYFINKKEVIEKENLIKNTIQ